MLMRAIQIRRRRKVRFLRPGVRRPETGRAAKPADWYAEAGDAMAASYQQKLEPALNRIVSYLVKRKFPTRS